MFALYTDCAQIFDAFLKWAGVIYTEYLAFSGLVRIFDAVEAFASEYGKNMAPSPALVGRTFPHGTASLC